MADEAREAPAAARRQRVLAGPTLAELGARLRARPPAFVVTCARGSSDHAATYGKYLIETVLGRAVASVGPSVASLYGRGLAVEGALFVAVSQSGQSPDLLRLTEAARAGGALTVGLVNDEASPLAARCEVVVPLCAGPERSVAATKSFLTAAVALLHLVAAWSDDRDLAAAVDGAGDALDAACGLDATAALAPLVGATSAFVVGRGPGLGVAMELALKLAETAGLHAQAFSSAEVLHGPVALVRAGFPVVPITQDDETAAATAEVLARLARLGADLRAPPATPRLPAPLAPLAQLQALYLALPALAAARGRDVDAPPHLRKVTETT